VASPSSKDTWRWNGKTSNFLAHFIDPVLRYLLKKSFNNISEAVVIITIFKIVKRKHPLLYKNYQRLRSNLHLISTNTYILSFYLSFLHCWVIFDIFRADIAVCLQQWPHKNWDQVSNFGGFRQEKGLFGGWNFSSQTSHGWKQ